MLNILRRRRSRNILLVGLKWKTRWLANLYSFWYIMFLGCRIITCSNNKSSERVNLHDWNLSSNMRIDTRIAIYVKLESFCHTLDIVYKLSFCFFIDITQIHIRQFRIFCIFPSTIKTYMIHIFHITCFREQAKIR